MLLDDYLDYLYESKWKRLLAAGKLGKDDLRKIQKAGLPKSRKQWLAGVEKGSEEKVRKIGGKVHHRFGPGVSAGGEGKKIKDPMKSYASNKDIHVPAGVSKKQRSTAAIVKKHEADEASIYNKLRKKVGSSFDVKTTATVPGKHMSDEVLRRERELIRTHSALYGKKPIKKFVKTRKTADDVYKTVGSKKQIKKYDRRKQREHQKYLKRLEMIAKQRKAQELKKGSKK
jgi:hypothetical protein